MSNLTEIDRLIEEGLVRYGHGDLDGALDAWERALAMEPDNAQASSYVEYVRQNYELLGSEAAPANAEHGGPFAIDHEPYLIEILPGELPEGSEPELEPPMQIDPADSGWLIGEEPAPRRQRASSTGEPLELELVIEDEPNPGDSAISFEDETREYPGGPSPREPEFRTELTPGFELTAHTPPGGFTQVTPGFEQSTDVRKRETGFVQPTGEQRSSRATEPPPELKMTLRTPAQSAPPAPAGPPPAGPPPITLSYDDPPPDEAPGVDLLESLPNPTRSPGAEVLVASSQPTRELPSEMRAPARSPTRDFANEKTARRPGAVAGLAVPDLDGGRLPVGPGAARELVTAPTRDLGIRPLEGRTPTPPPDDEPTKTRRPRDDGTRQDVVLPFDPIDARSAQLLDELEAGAPAQESHEERTRRRITRLFERASELARDGELDRAVAAIDLALAEDPNSALAQKLIHRNREVMMQVFQGFLGDLDRTPVLARPLHELASAPISPRAAFLLSRIDGTLSLDEILDVSGMPRIEAYRYLSQLYLRGILR